MSDKEEIEDVLQKIRNGFREFKDCNNYLYPLDLEQFNTIKNYIEQLETQKQDLIEKLEEDKKKWQEFHNRVPEVPEYIDYILPFVKGEDK